MKELRKRFVKETGEDLLMQKTFGECKVKVDLWNDRYIDWLEKQVTLGLPSVSECGECGRDLNKYGKCDSQLCKNYDWHW